MQLLDRDILQAKAMIIDANATSRSIMAAQLRELGVQEVRQVARVQDARLTLERQPHDIVLCEMNFDGAPMSGQDLLDELRREQLLPPATAFILVTGSATYAQVMEAAESTVDAYLIKPYSALALAERLAEARRRKRALQPVYAAIAAGDHAAAAALAEQRHQARQGYGRLCAQMAAELWLRAGEPARALAVFEAVLAERPQAWARLGVVRVRLAHGETAAARRELQALVQAEPGCADAHDLLARVCLEQGEFEPALQALCSASTLTPGCLLRLQHCGALAFHLGQREEAERWLERAAGLGRGSKLLDPMALALLALLKLDRREARGFVAALDTLGALAAAAPESARLQRLNEIALGLRAVQARRVDEARAVASRLAAQTAEPDFDLEAAALTLALWLRLPAADAGAAPAADDAALAGLLGELALRFGSTKANTETLLGVAHGHEAAQALLRQGHAEITQIAEQALHHSLKGRAAAAVDMLLEQGSRTRNAKLIEMALAVAQRHPEQVGDLQAVQARVRPLQERWCAAPTHLAGVRRSARQPGGVALRA